MPVILNTPIATFYNFLQDVNGVRFGSFAHTFQHTVNVLFKDMKIGKEEFDLDILDLRISDRSYVKTRAVEAADIVTHTDVNLQKTSFMILS
jgi:hypothetical protein